MTIVVEKVSTALYKIGFQIEVAPSFFKNFIPSSCCSFVKHERTIRFFLMSLDLPRLIEGSKEEKTGIYWCNEAVCGNDCYWDYLVIRQEIVLSLVFFFTSLLYLSVSIKYFVIINLYAK